MTYTNIQMEQMLANVEPLLSKKGLVGYAAARNARVLKGEIAEYIEMKNSAISELGEEEVDGEGRPTGHVTLKFDSPAFEEYKRRMDGVDTAVSEPKIFRVRAADVMDQLSGEEMLKLDWMIDFDEDAQTLDR